MPATVRREPHTYDRESRHSFFRDLQRMKQGGPEALEAEVRLKAHQHETRVDARGELPPEGTEFRVTLNETSGTGGTFAPPRWVIDLYAEANVASRPLADRTPTVPLPSGAQSIVVPRWSTGQTVATTGTQNTAPSQTIPVDVTGGVTSQVAAIAGQVPVSQQWLEQSPSGPGADAVIYNGLLMSYNQQLETQCLYGTGAGGQLLGLVNVTGIVSVTYTSGTPTVAGLWPLIGQAIGQIADTRGLPATDVFMSPRRWAWIVSSLDANNRINFAGPGNYGNLVNQLGGEQVYGLTTPKSIDGLPTWEDGSIAATTASRVFTDGGTTNLSPTLTSTSQAQFTQQDVGKGVSGTGIPGSTTILSVQSATSATMSANATATGTGISVTIASTTEDWIFVTRPADHLIMESEPHTLVNFEQQAANLTTIVTMHRYCAFFPHRHPASTAVISGTGLSAPAGF